MSNNSNPGRGQVSLYRIPRPTSNQQLFQLLSQELSNPALRSIHIEVGAPIVVEHYTHPDDMNGGAIQRPQEIMRHVEPLLDVKAKKTPQETFLSLMIRLQQLRQIPCAILVGSKNHFMNWLDLPEDLRIFMHPLVDENCDFLFLGIQGYVDDSLTDDRLVMLGGDRPEPSMTSVRVGLMTVMEVNNEPLSTGGSEGNR